MDIHTLINLPTIQRPTLSNDGTRLAFYTETLDLAVFDIATESVTTLPLAGAIPTVPLAFVWGSNDTHLYFSRDEAGTERYDIYRVALADGEVQRLTNNSAASDYILDVSGDVVLFGSNRAGTMNLFTLHLSTWAITQLTDHNRPIMDAMFSPDGLQIVFNANTTDSPRNVNVHLINTDGSNEYILLQTNQNAQDGFSDWVGRSIAVHSDNDGVRRSGIIDTKSKKVKWLSPRTGNYWAGRLSPDGQHMLAYLNQDSAIQPVLIETKTGKVITPKLPAGLYYNGQWLSAREALFEMEADTAPKQVIRYNLSQKRRSPLYHPAAGHDVGPFAGHEYLRYPSVADDIPALLYKPKGKGPFPAVVYLHGGPTTQFFRGFDVLAQALVSAGFLVLMPNVRGSTGYGIPFRDAIVRNWGGPDLEDVIAAHSYLQTRPDVIGDKIGVYGGSYGGYLVYLAMTKHPDAYAAGLALNGITDIIALEASADPHYAQVLRRYMGDPDTAQALWQQRSAINFAAGLAKPLLMIHAANDPRCPLPQAESMAAALDAAGKVRDRDFWLEVWEDEGHARGDVSGKLRTVTRILAFFGEQLAIN